MLKFLLIAIKLTLVYFALTSRISFLQLYLLNSLTIFITYNVFKQIIKYKAWILAIIIIDTALPIIGFFAIAIFVALSPIYKMVYNKAYRDEIVDNTHDLDSHFQKYIQLQNARIQKVDLSSMQDKLLDSIQIQPYIDILLGHDTDMKISACIKLSQFQTFQTVYLLKMALQDKEYEVRYMANNALTGIEKKLIDKIDILTDNINKFPHLYTYYKERAYTYLTIYKLNILDNYIGKMFLERALNDLRVVISNEPDNFNTYTSIAEVYTHLDMNDEVITLVNKSLLLDISGEHKTKLLYYRCEAYFKQKRFDLIVQDSLNLDSKYMDFKKIKESVIFWKEFTVE